MTEAESLTLKEGDLVRVLPREMHSPDEANAFTSDMETYIGMVYEVARVLRRIEYCLVSLRTEDGVPCKDHGFHWYFYPSHIERVVVEDDVCSPDVRVLESMFLAAE